MELVCLPIFVCWLVRVILLRRPGIVKGIEVKGRIKSIVGRLGVAGLRRRKWSGCGHDEVVRKGVVDDVEDVTVRINKQDQIMTL